MRGPSAFPLSTLPSARTLLLPEAMPKNVTLTLRRLVQSPVPLENRGAGKETTDPLLPAIRNDPLSMLLLTVLNIKLRLEISLLKLRALQLTRLLVFNDNIKLPPLVEEAETMQVLTLPVTRTVKRLILLELVRTRIPLFVPTSGSNIRSVAKVVSAAVVVLVKEALPGTPIKRLVGVVIHLVQVPLRLGKPTKLATLLATRLLAWWPTLLVARIAVSHHFRQATTASRFSPARR